MEQFHVSIGLRHQCLPAKEVLDEFFGPSSYSFAQLKNLRVSHCGPKSNLRSSYVCLES